MYRIGLLLKLKAAHHFTLLLVPTPPPLSSPLLSSSADEEDDTEKEDIPLWDLPWASLPPSHADQEKKDQISDVDSCSVSSHVRSALHNIGISHLDTRHSIRQLKEKLGAIWEYMEPWIYWKFVEEPDYGPGPQCQTIIFMSELRLGEELLPRIGKWLTSEDAWRILTGGPGDSIRIGPLASYSFSPHFPEGLQHKLSLTMKAQEYPPGLLLVPLASSTRNPFSKTNLVVFSCIATPHDNIGSLITGEALIVDPACHPIEAQDQLSAVVNALPRRLLIFLTHHHFDHIEGLPTVYKWNPEAVILAHEFTLSRLGKDGRKFKCLPVVDGSVIFVGDQELRVIGAAGHTLGHMALLHVPTHTLIAGDHCVGQGSALLDVRSGGNMEDYFTTTRKFIDLAPHVIVPMHGHFNLWPVHMMRSYLGHRKAREAKILHAIEQGAHEAFDIVSRVYADTPTSLWMSALSNVILHVDHLNHLEKLPKEFSIASFKRSCKLGFFLKLIGRSVFGTTSFMGNGGMWKVYLGLSLGSAWLLWRKLH